ncbi:YceI family protein [Pseudooctadecabacter sp.]|uniref:YceI family protein n=1 Tax=Pseudooctadecabacter sp. TaxID=1966338 RepID=UPI0025E6BC4B|nr:YceI family protein [Pseudooctadecabacter sp.]
MKTLLLSSALTAAAATSVWAEATPYTLDASHSQIVFSYDHLGYSRTTGMFSGFEGTIMFDEADPSASSVEVSFPAESLITGWPAREGHFLSDDFFGAEANPVVSFTSTAIEVTGDNTGVITGDLTINGITQSVALDAKLNQASNHPMQEKPWVGFDATTTLLRSDFDMGNFAPFVGDEVDIYISIEAAAADS